MKKRIPNIPSQAALAMQLVTLHSRKATTTSLIVAEVFEKQHRNVLRDIEKLISDLPENSWLNFERREYVDDRGKTWPMFEMNRDGFSLLAMGFTGKKALEWKLKYLRAFSMMEQTEVAPIIGTGV
jgi:Rha family phage regulatory protein